MPFFRNGAVITCNVIFLCDIFHILIVYGVGE